MNTSYQWQWTIINSGIGVCAASLYDVWGIDFITTCVAIFFSIILSGLILIPIVEQQDTPWWKLVG